MDSIVVLNAAEYIKLARWDEDKEFVVVLVRPVLDASDSFSLAIGCCDRDGLLKSLDGWYSYHWRGTEVESSREGPEPHFGRAARDLLLENTREDDDTIIRKLISQTAAWQGSDLGLWLLRFGSLSSFFRFQTGTSSRNLLQDEESYLWAQNSLSEGSLVTVLPAG